MQVYDPTFLCCEDVAKTDYIRDFYSLYLGEGSCTDNWVGHFSHNCRSVKIFSERVVDSVLLKLDTAEHCWLASFKQMFEKHLIKGSADRAVVEQSVPSFKKTCEMRSLRSNQRRVLRILKCKQRKVAIWRWIRRKSCSRLRTLVLLNVSLPRLNFEVFGGGRQSRIAREAKIVDRSCYGLRPKDR